jgi:hypothetical protein
MVAHKVKKARHHCIELGEVYIYQAKNGTKRLELKNTEWILSHSSSNLSQPFMQWPMQSSVPCLIKLPNQCEQATPYLTCEINLFSHQQINLHDS